MAKKPMPPKPGDKPPPKGDAPPPKYSKSPGTGTGETPPKKVKGG